MGTQDAPHEKEPEPGRRTTAGIGDEELPEELRPTDDNPLAQPLDEAEAKSPEELDMQGGKTPEGPEPPKSDEPDEDSSPR